MGVDMWVSAGMTALTVVGGVVTARAARRTRRQEKRDDFTAIKDALNERIDDLKKDVVGQQEQITGQGAAISWLVVDRRSLVSTIRTAGLKTPIPRPIPERAMPFLDHVEL